MARSAGAGRARPTAPGARGASACGPEAAARSADRGTALTGALDRQAADLRAAKVAVANAATRRVGVLVILPLGLCFLPAFVLVGVVPVVVAVLHDVLQAL